MLFITGIFIPLNKWYFYFPDSWPHKENHFMLILIPLFYKNPSNNFLGDMICEDVFPLQILVQLRIDKSEYSPEHSIHVGFFNSMGKWRYSGFICANQKEVKRKKNLGSLCSVQVAVERHATIYSKDLLNSQKTPNPKLNLPLDTSAQ